MNGNILVVDDEKELADVLELYLTSDGFTLHKGTISAECGSALIFSAGKEFLHGIADRPCIQTVQGQKSRQRHQCGAAPFRRRLLTK